MSEITHWKILNKFDFELLPGEPGKVDGEAQSYYEYLNSRSHETGKNVQAMMYALGDVEPGRIIEEPFGGVGVFSVALNNTLTPREHRILELDEGCYRQLQHVFSANPSVKLKLGDAHDIMGVLPADVFVCDFPFFTMLKFWEQHIWRNEVYRMIALKPDSIIITDGTSYNYHLSWKHLHKRDNKIQSDRPSYIKTMSSYFYWAYNYSITRCGYHGTCFYYNLVSGLHDPNNIEFKHYPSGSGIDGLRREPPA